MDKESILEELSAAKLAHLKWVKRAKSLISGMSMEKEGIPVECTDCVFGKWFYSTGQDMIIKPGMTVLESIGTKHTEFHQIYFKIFQVYFSDEEKSFFSKFLNIKRKISPSEQEMAEGYYAELEVVSKELLDLLSKLERRISALDRDFFSAK